MNAENKIIRQQYFDKICPALYRDTEVKRLPAAQYKQIMDWSVESGRGLYLLGPSGTGKTRCMWKLIERITMTTWINVRVFDSLKWQVEVSRAFGQPEYTEEWLDKVSDAPILFIDDMFKGKMTDAQSHAAHGVLERRSAHRRPTFCTSNVDGDNLSSRVIEPTTAESILRRITEFCDVVEFSA